MIFSFASHVFAKILKLHPFVGFALFNEKAQPFWNLSQ